MLALIICIIYGLFQRNILNYVHINNTYIYEITMHLSGKNDCIKYSNSHFFYI